MTIGSILHDMWSIFKEYYIGEGLLWTGIGYTLLLAGIAVFFGTLLGSLLARCPMNVEATGSRRDFIMDRRGEGVPIILAESEKLSGKRPVYRLLDDAELLLTIFAAPEPGEG